MIGQQIAITAGQFVGWVKETTRANDGPWVEAIQRVTGNKKGDAWCASFVAFVLDISYRGANPLPRTASCDALLEYAKAKGLLTTAPRAGDVFLVMKTPTDAHHTGFCTGPAVAGRVPTIEGNTNTDGSRDGWGVFARTRAVAALQFIRLPEAV